MAMLVISKTICLKGITEGDGKLYFFLVNFPF